MNKDAYQAAYTCFDTAPHELIAMLKTDDQNLLEDDHQQDIQLLNICIQVNCHKCLAPKNLT